MCGENYFFLHLEKPHNKFGILVVSVLVSLLSVYVVYGVWYFVMLRAYQIIGANVSTSSFRDANLLNCATFLRKGEMTQVEVFELETPVVYSIVSVGPHFRIGLKMEREKTGSTLRAD